MSQFKYSDEEQELNKVLKMNQDRSNALLKDPEMEKTRQSADASIESSFALLKRLGKEDAVSELESQTQGKSGKRQLEHRPQIEGWESTVQEAETLYPEDVVLEDILSQAEFESAYQELADINREFQRCTSLNGIDISMLVVAAALQTIRWALMPAIGEPMDKASRITDKEGDALVKQLKKEFAEKHKNWPVEKAQQGRRLREQEGKTWKEIIFSGVPYDAISGSKDVLDVGLTGNTHRYKTLGHDPILGWIFGTSNILTDTLTLNNLMSYRVQNGHMTSQTLLAPQLFLETSNQIQSDKYKLPAAIFRQAIHYKSDIYTKKGLPVPLLGAFSETLAGKLYSSDYDFLCFVRDSKIEGTSLLLSVLINMIIGLIHGLYYNEERDGTRNLFEVRTRKILLYSNALASTGNVAATLITKNAKLLDIGGLLVTISRLYSDARFIARIKKEFIDSKITDSLQAELSEIDRLYNEI